MQRGLAAFPTPKNPSAPKTQGLSDSRTSVTPSQTRNTPKFSNTEREKALTLGKDQFQLETFHLETSEPEFPTSCCPRTAQKMQVHHHSQNCRTHGSQPQAKLLPQPKVAPVSLTRGCPSTTDTLTPTNSPTLG